MTSQQVEGVRSDPDQRGLVVSYVGGMCDGPARLEVTETATRIEADVRFEVLGTGACPDMGILRSVGARLDGPIGDRSVRISGERYVPFDGATLLTPTRLPADSAGIRETGITPETPASPDGARVTTTWVITRFKPPSDTEPCRAGPGSLETRIGTGSAAQPRGLTRIGQANVGQATAILYRSGSATEPDALAYAWDIGRQSIAITSSISCNGDTVLNPRELLDVAESLQPA